MTPRAFCEPGRAEALKLSVHAVLGALAAACVVYNAAALIYRRERHLAVNAVVYGALTAVEVVQVRRHLRSL